MMQETYSLQSSTGYWVTRLARAIEAELEVRLEKHGMTRATWAVLSAMWHHEMTTPAALASFIGIDRAAMTRHLDRLEKQKIIARDRSSTDRRSINLKLTPKGKQLVPLLVSESKAANAKFATGLSDAENDKLKTLIRRMLTNSDVPLPDL